MSKLLIAHGGGPTSVLNASLYGVIEEAKKYPEIDGIYGAIGGVAGILNENFIDLSIQPQKELELLPYTPGSAIGSSRYKLQERDYHLIVEKLKKYDIKYFLYNGGNGSMDTCYRVYKVAGDSDLRVIGIPKTVDNDIEGIDHCPGYGSAARFVATAVAEIGMDVRSLPIHVCIVEVMGRNTGWLAASSVLARREAGDAPHLIYLPERPFILDKFLQDVKTLHSQLGGVVVVVSEGLMDEKGEPITLASKETDYRNRLAGDVASYLAWQIMDQLGIRARSEKPGLLGRACVEMQSPVDRLEAIEVGRYAVKAAREGKTGYMVGIRRLSGSPYRVEYTLIPLDSRAIAERKVPDTYINERGNYVNDEFIQYCKPLIGGELPRFTRLNK